MNYFTSYIGRTCKPRSTFQKVKSPPASATGGGRNQSGSPGNPAAAAAPDGFCCILCGFKEQSVEKLKDHINMHFIGQVKKSPGGTLSTEHPEINATGGGGRDSASPGTRNISTPSPSLSSGRRRRKVSKLYRVTHHLKTVVGLTNTWGVPLAGRQLL